MRQSSTGIFLAFAQGVFNVDHGEAWTPLQTQQWYLVIGKTEAFEPDKLLVPNITDGGLFKPPYTFTKHLFQTGSGARAQPDPIVLIPIEMREQIQI